MTKIMGQAVATAEQMTSYLLSVNPLPQISIPVLELCRLFLSESAKEGVRGDILFAQSCKETGNFKFRGTVKPEQNNYAGLGTINAGTQGAYFPSPAVGILAQAQHAKGYATTDDLFCECVDPRYDLLKKCGKVGSAQNVEQLGGKWAVPGYDVTKYASLEDANAAEDSYGYQILDILNKILNTEVKKMGKVIIALDAGHYFYTAGKRCLKSIDPNETREWTLNDRINDRVEELLVDYDCEIVRVDDTTGEKEISLSKRVKAANDAGADVYISTHHNAGINGKKTIGGTVVYYYGNKELRVVQASDLYNCVQSKTNLPVHPTRAKVVKKGFFVLANTKMPAFLLENGFMDSPIDVPIILTAEHAEKTAQGIVDFLVKDFALIKKQKNSETQKESADTEDITILTNPFIEPLRDVKRGQTGNDVGWVQWYLWRFGLFVDAGGNADESQIDKKFGADTQAAVKEAQKRLGMAQTGIVKAADREVWKKLC